MWASSDSCNNALKRGHMPNDQQWNEIVMGRVPPDRFQKGGR